MKRIAAIVLTVLMAFCIFPIVSAATDGSITTDGTYDISVYGTNATITIDPGLTVTLTNTGNTQFQNMHIVCGAGTALSINNVNINNSLAVGSCPLSFTGTGNTLNLIGTNTLSAGEDVPGIRVSEGTSLEIMGSGRVNVTGSKHGAGIGAGYNEAGGSIKISSGTIYATGGNYAAAIGMGGNDIIKRPGGNITITGGNINATGPFGGSGIGGGWWTGAGNITISGGTVYATSTGSGAAIGSGYIAGEPGSIHITGGTVKAIATEGSNCAGLGGGNWSSGLDITIEGGTVTAVGGDRGAGIGGAYQRDAGNITITGGSIYASKGADDGSIGTDPLSTKDIGDGKDGKGGSLNISGNAAIFLKHDIYLEPTTTSHQHFVINDTDNVYGYTIPSDYSYPFGAFFALYTLTYDVNSGTGTVVDPTTQIVDSTIIVEDGNGLSRYSYTFGGWSTVSDGSGTIYQPGDTFNFTNNTTLYAKWDEIPVDSVTLSKTSIELVHHDTSSLTADVLPTNATHPEVTWTSNNSSVATVDSSGNIVAAGVGSAVITAEADGVSAECTVTVNKKPVESVLPSQMSLTLIHHDVVSLTAEVLPANASYPVLTWTSSDSSVVTVDSSGIVVAAGVGSTVITATADGVSEVCTVTVNKKPVDSVTLSEETMTMLHHDTAVLTTEVLPVNATYPEVTWESSDTEVVTVDQSGNIEAVGLGSAVITATADGVSDTCAITVNKRPVTSVTLSEETSMELVHHDTGVLTAEVLPSNATYPEVNWESSNTEVVTVDQSGNIEAVGLGNAVITATADGISDTCNVTVNKKPVESITLSKETITMEHHDTASLTAEVLPVNATYPEVTWESSDDTIVSVDQNGKITAINLGVATITATADGVSDICVVTVNKKPVASVTLNSTDEEVFVGDVVTLAADVLPINATYPEVIWVSSDETLATVNENGVVTTIKGGRVTITATADGVSVDCNIFIIQPVTSVTLSSSSKTMIHHDTLTLTSEVLPDDATYPVVTWSTSNKNVATVNQSGKVTAVGVGSATITSTADGISDVCVITVKKKPVTDVALKSKLSLVHHDAVTLTASVTPSDATYPQVTWESSDTSVATIDETGRVLAVGVGSAEITATADDVTTVCKVTVEKKSVTAVTLNETALTLILDDASELTASVAPSNATYPQVTWESSDTTVVTVDETGSVLAVGIGSAEITATADDVTTVCKVTVEKKSVTAVTLNETALTLNPDGTFELTASVEPSNATYPQVTWKSSDPSVAEVDNTGVVKAINTGSAVVTVEADGIAATCEVTVEPVSKKTVTITGVLTDDKGKPLAGKTVELHSDPMSTVTDSEGRFTFEDVCVEHHTLIIKDNAGDPIKEFEIDLNTKDDFEWEEDEDTCVNIMLSNKTAAVELSISLNNEDFGITDVQDVTYPSEEKPSSKSKFILIGGALLLAVFVGILVTLMVKRRKAS